MDRMLFILLRNVKMPTITCSAELSLNVFETSASVLTRYKYHFASVDADGDLFLTGEY